MVTEDNEYPLMAFIANEGVAPKGDRFDRSALVKNADSKKYKRTKYGDFIYSSNNLESGSIGLNKYGKASISPVYSIFYPTNLADSDFIGRYFLRKDFIGQMIRWRQGVVYGQWKIPEADFLNIDIYIPSKDEQEKIGQILDKVDNTITLQQRKLNSLQKLKKGLLQKMFPKNGENIPEIRFPEFSDAWKQRKLSDISEKITEKNTELKEQETLTNSAELGIISQSDFFDHRISNESNINNYYVVSPNDFVYNPRISVTAPVGPINRNKLKRTGIMSPLYTVFKTHDVDCSFLEFFFKSSSWHKFMHFNGDSGARSDRFSIKDNVFFTMPIFVPSLSEQVKIGEFLTILHNPRSPL